MRRPSILALAVVTSAALGACARPALQKPAPLRAGDRVRVTAPSPRASLVGTLVALGDSDLTVAANVAHTTRFRRRDVRRLEVRTGTERQSFMGSRIGVVLGFVAGLGWGLQTPMHCDMGRSGLFSFAAVECLSDIGGRSGWVLIHGMFGGAAGGLIGGGLGWLVKTSRWEAVPLEGQRPIGLAPPVGRVNVGLSITLPH